MPHFFIESANIKNNSTVINDKETVNHITKSLRMTANQKILLIDENKIQYEGVISESDKNTVTVDIKKSYPSKRFLNFDLHLAQSPLRSEKQSLLIEKATELGVNHIYPIYTDNCALKKTVIEQKIEKWQKIMAESSKQCERAFIPTCHKLTNIQELIETQAFDRVLAFTERDAQIHVKKYLSENPINNDEKILVIIGPEGGFSDAEFEYFKENKNIITLSLGELILRAETAVIVALGSLVL